MIGDTIKVLFTEAYHVHNKIEGTITQIFDALTDSGEEGKNLQIDIRFGKNGEKWFRYKPMSDGGTYEITPRNNNDNR